jgi:hypothetical protein
MTSTPARQTAAQNSQSVGDASYSARDSAEMAVSFQLLMVRQAHHERVKG